MIMNGKLVRRGNKSAVFQSAVSDFASRIEETKKEFVIRSNSQPTKCSQVCQSDVSQTASASDSDVDNHFIFIEMYFLWCPMKSFVLLKSSIVWDISLYSPLKVNRRFGVKCGIHFQGQIMRQGTIVKVGSKHSLRNVGCFRTDCAELYSRG
jgi:hypothetical protein